MGDLNTNYTIVPITLLIQIYMLNVGENIDGLKSA